MPQVFRCPICDVLVDDAGPFVVLQTRKHADANGAAMFAPDYLAHVFCTVRIAQDAIHTALTGATRKAAELDGKE